MLMFGGSDTDHKPMNDLWELDVLRGKWERLVSASTRLPAPRNCFAAAMIENAGSSEMLVYGGFHLGDLWAYSLEDRTWTLLSNWSDPVPDHPGIRAAHSAATGPGSKDMYVYAGFRFDTDVIDKERFAVGRLDDLSRWNILAHTWHLVHQQKSIGVRQFFPMELVSWSPSQRENFGLVVMGGTQCNPNCSLVGTTDFFSLSTGIWHRVEVDRAPIHRYQHTMVAHGGALWVFGGESFDPH